jgi:hypothetical protein
MVTPDLTAYLETISPHATNQLKLQERMVSALKGLHYDNPSSRSAAAVTLKAIQAELERLAQIVIAVRTPTRLAVASAAHGRAIEQLGSAASELGNALIGDPTARVKRIERALGLAREAERSARALTESDSAALGAAAYAAASIPVIGPIIAAILALIAAIIFVIASILEKAKEEDAAEKERQESGRTRPHRRPWPP